ncbi:hypothetical protein [Nonomuraea sediminis]|uniref:hypothetical protein n=1 Tax=Nonomuraea sediminis TaxID=2835864 RepID=UPI001BDCFDA5|nr:hypothetical protein [Nonomuraea sediminis]
MKLAIIVAVNASATIPRVNCEFGNIDAAPSMAQVVYFRGLLRARARGVLYRMSTEKENLHQRAYSAVLAHDASLRWRQHRHAR